MVKIIVITSILFYIAIVCGIYIKLLDFRAPKSSIIYAFMIPIILININIRVLKITLEDYPTKNKLTFAMGTIKFILIAIRNSSIIAGMVCVELCSAYNKGYLLKYDFSNILKINLNIVKNIFSFDILNSPKVVEEVSAILVKA